MLSRDERQDMAASMRMAYALLSTMNKDNDPLIERTAFELSKYSKRLISSIYEEMKSCKPIKPAMPVAI